MSVSLEFAALFRRDLTRLTQELDSFSDESSLWATSKGIRNAAGTLALHLEGNLREYIGRQLGQVPYVRQRDLEFTTRGISKAELISRIESVRALVVRVIEAFTPADLDAWYPEAVLKTPVTSRQFLIHLLAHLNYHLGQIDYARRLLTEGTAIALASV